MSRRKRGWLNRACYHVTHRCHERKYLFKFIKYRELYVKLLYEMRKKYNVDVLDYIVTSNHVHLLVTAAKGENISRGLQFLHGRIAQKYNLSKEREGSFWRNRFHSTRIQTGEHLGRCIFYIDMNMVRAGAVGHPSEWKHTAYHEFTGPPKRYRVINMEKLLNCLEIADEERFREWYYRTLEAKVKAFHGSKNKRAHREPFWSKSVAVGDESWLPEAGVYAGMKRCCIKTYQNENGEKIFYL